MKNTAMRKNSNPTKQYYEKNAQQWAQRKTDSFYQIEQFRSFLKFLKKGDRVIEIGSAHGITVPLFLGLGRKLKYEGYDISKSFLKLAKFRYPQIKFGYMDIADRKTLPKKTFNAFWASAVLMHVPYEKWDLMLSNIEKLVPHGYGYITLPEMRPSPETEEDQRHFNYFTPKDLKKVVAPRKWKVLKSGKLPDPRKNYIWNWFIVKLP